jgi:Asp-tRNA(Asn)/Glu-tRNA(Gln) amidotransferase A subunit family amidase
MVLQDGIGWDDDHDISMKAERTIEEKVDRAIDRSFDKMTVMGSDGEEIDVPAEAKRAMASAVAELVKAETDLAVARVGEDDEEAVKAARSRREKARAEVDRLEAEIRKLDRASGSDREAIREQFKREVQEDVSGTMKEAVGG